MRTFTIAMVAMVAAAVACGTKDKTDRRGDALPTLDSLALTDPSLFTRDEPERATDPWQFIALMRGLLPANASNHQVSDFLKAWLIDWSRTRPQVREKLLCRWLDESNGVPGCRDGELDLGKAPFKPIAIVNRMDLHDPEHCEDAGELRIAFAWVDSAGRELPLTVAFEYVVPTHFRTVAEWATVWKGLGSFQCRPGDCQEYRAFVASITQEVVDADRDDMDEFEFERPASEEMDWGSGIAVQEASQSAPGRNNLRHVRVHDRAFGSTEFREFDFVRSGGRLLFHLAETGKEETEKCAGCHTGAGPKGERFNVTPGGDGGRLHHDLLEMMPARAERLDELAHSTCERTPSSSRHVPW